MEQGHAEDPGGRTRVAAPRMPDFAARPARLGTRVVLVAGFGGVLGLMALAGLDSVRALHRIETQNTQITQSYLLRHHFLEQVRAGLYQSSATVSDYLLELHPEAAKAAVAKLQELRGETTAAASAYSASLLPGERSVFSELKTDVSSYWSAVDQVLQWSPEQRQAEGQQRLETEILPRRRVALSVADKATAANELALSNSEQRSAELFVSYRRRVIEILGLTLGIGLVLASASIIHILRLENASRLRYGQLQRAQEELKKLSARLVEAQEQERRTISRELHDEVGQSLNALLVDLGNLAAVMPPGDQEAQRLLATAKQLANESVNVLRNMALLLRPSMLDDFGLVPALHWQAREVERRTAVRIDLEAEDVPDELPDDYKTCVYRVVQEALHNASQHAEARNVRISIRQHQGRMVLAIRDDGKGFDAARVRGLGLLGMEERVKHLDGSFAIRSWPGQGTELRIELPLAESRPV
jgi:signal transduction histidine kinase